MITCRLHFPAPAESNPMVLEEIEMPRPRQGQVRIKVEMCGVCHTDLHTVEGEIRPPHLPITPGHQVVGTIDGIPDNFPATENVPSIERLKPGQRVGLPWLYSTCGECEFCKRGMENLCPNAQFTGFHVDGGYAEYVLADARYVLPIPDELSNEQAAPLLCAGIVGYRSLKIAGIMPGERVGLFGFGASAHLCIQVLKYWGCEVSVFTRAKSHQEHARQLGANWVGSADDDPDKPLDRAVIFAPVGALAVRALEWIRPGGRVAINAIHMSDIPAFPYEKIYGERSLHSVANATYRDGVEFIDLALAAGVKSTVNLYPLEEANQALQDLKASRFNGEAVLKVN